MKKTMFVTILLLALVVFVLVAWNSAAAQSAPKDGREIESTLLWGRSCWPDKVDPLLNADGSIALKCIRQDGSAAWEEVCTPLDDEYAVVKLLKNMFGHLRVACWSARVDTLK